MFDPSQIKAIISDFDNTLTPTTEVDLNVVRAIHKINKTDVIFTIATGRHGYGVIQQVAKSLELSHPVIVCGGAEILDKKTDTLTWNTYIETKTSKEIIDLLIQMDIMFTAESGNKIFGHKYPFTSNYSNGLTQVNFEEIQTHPVSKIVPRPDWDQLETLYDVLLEKFKDIHITKTRSQAFYGVLDITHAQASKHIAVLEFCKLYELDPHQVIGIGDSYNDYPLLTACGYKVATQDAPDELKAIADEIIPPASQNGILEILNRF